MPRTVLSDSEIEAFRRRTVEVATRLFVDRGPERVSIRMIASELGVSAMTPYRYFENRDEIFAMVRADAFRRFADGQEAAYEDGRGAPREVLERLGRAYADFALENPDAYRVMFQISKVEPGRYPAVDRESERGISFLIRAVETAVAEGIYNGDPLTIAQLRWAEIHGIVSLHLAGILVAGRTIDQLVDAMLQGDL